jgi:plasmid stability protein
MNAITIDKLSPKAWRKLEELARAHHRSIEDEVAEVIERAVGDPQAHNWRQESAARIASMTPKGVKQDDSTLLIREDRDR